MSENLIKEHSRYLSHTAAGKSRITLFRTFRYRSEVHSENLAGNVKIWLCDRANLQTFIVSYGQFHWLLKNKTCLSNSLFMISITSSGNLWIFLWLRSMVTPGFKSSLTPLASAALVSFSSRAFFIASRASSTTWAGGIGICVGVLELESEWGYDELGVRRTVFRGAGLIAGPVSINGRPVDCVAIPRGPVGRSITGRII